MCSNLLKFQRYDSTTWNVHVCQMFEILTVIYSNSRCWKCQTKSIYGKPERHMLVMVRWLYMMVLILAGGQQWTKEHLPRKNIWLVLFLCIFFAANCLQSTKYFLINRKLYAHGHLFFIDPRLTRNLLHAFKGNSFCISIYNKKNQIVCFKTSFSKIIPPKFNSIWLNCFHEQFYHIIYKIFDWLLFNLK